MARWLIILLLSAAISPNVSHSQSDASQAAVPEPWLFDSYSCEIWLDAQAVSRTTGGVSVLVAGHIKGYSNERLKTGFSKLLRFDGDELSIGEAKVSVFGVSEPWPSAKVMFYVRGKYFGPYEVPQAIDEVPNIRSKYRSTELGAADGAVENKELIENTTNIQNLNNNIECLLFGLETNLMQQVANNRLIEILESESEPNQSSLVVDLLATAGYVNENSVDGLLGSLQRQAALLERKNDGMRGELKQ